MATIDEKLVIANDNVAKVYAAGGSGIDLSNYVKKTDYATASTVGVVKVPSTSGIELESDGSIFVNAASVSEIAERTESRRPIVPANLNAAIKAALTDSNRISDMTDTEKSNARKVIGADYGDDIRQLEQLLIPEAPIDDTIYGRKNGAWSEIINGLPTVTMEQVDVYDSVNYLPRGIYVLVHDYVWETDPDYGDQMYYERDLLIVSDYTYFSEPYTTQVRYTNTGKVMIRTACWNNTSATEWDDWDVVTYTKHEIDTALNAKADKTTVKTALTSPMTVNTIYNLGKQTALSITLPSGSIGKFIQFDFISGSTATTLTVNSSSGLTGFDLIPATDTVYSLYFDWGAIGYSGNTATYGWRFSYSEYPIEAV